MYTTGCNQLFFKYAFGVYFWTRLVFLSKSVLLDLILCKDVRNMWVEWKSINPCNVENTPYLRTTAIINEMKDKSYW